MKLLFVLLGFSGPRWPIEPDQWHNDQEEEVACWCLEVAQMAVLSGAVFKISTTTRQPTGQGGDEDATSCSLLGFSGPRWPIEAG